MLLSVNITLDLIFYFCAIAFEQGEWLQVPCKQIGYIFAVWAVVRKVASADNHSNPSRNLVE